MVPGFSCFLYSPLPHLVKLQPGETWKCDKLRALGGVGRGPVGRSAPKTWSQDWLTTWCPLAKFLGFSKPQSPQTMETVRAASRTISQNTLHIIQCSPARVTHSFANFLWHTHCMPGPVLALKCCSDRVGWEEKQANGFTSY